MYWQLYCTYCFLTGSHLLVRWVQEGTTTVVPVARAPDSETVDEGDESDVKWPSEKLYRATILKKGEQLSQVPAKKLNTYVYVIIQGQGRTVNNVRNSCSKRNQKVGCYWISRARIIMYAYALVYYPCRSGRITILQQHQRAETQTTPR